MWLPVCEESLPTAHADSSVIGELNLMVAWCERGFISSCVGVQQLPPAAHRMATMPWLHCERSPPAQMLG